MELSETCALCLSRLLSLICVPPRDTGPQLSDVASVSPPSDDAIQPTPSSQLHLLFKLDCCLEDVNVFTLSNLAGKYIYLHVPHHLNPVFRLMIAPLCPRYLVGPNTTGCTDSSALSSLLFVRLLFRSRGFADGHRQSHELCRKLHSVSSRC